MAKTVKSGAVENEYLMALLEIGTPELSSMVATA
jgi:hypothetical protein